MWIEGNHGFLASIVSNLDILQKDPITDIWHFTCCHREKERGFHDYISWSHYSNTNPTRGELEPMTSSQEVACSTAWVSMPSFWWENNGNVYPWQLEQSMLNKAGCCQTKPYADLRLKWPEWGAMAWSAALVCLALSLYQSQKLHLLPIRAICSSQVTQIQFCGKKPTCL